MHYETAASARGYQVTDMKECLVVAGESPGLISPNAIPAATNHLS